ncbi:hypothetical protein AB4211_22305 [Vibrio lentus]
MIIKIDLKALFTSVLVIVSSGCAETVQERRGQSIEVIPFQHSSSFMVKKSGQIKTELFDFIDGNIDVIIENGVSILWHTQQGKQLAELATKYMTNKGINHKLIALKQTDSPNERPFDLTLQYTEYKIVTQICSYESIGRFGSIETGCYTDNIRWQSMVNPERMLSSVR